MLKTQLTRQRDSELARSTGMHGALLKSAVAESFYVNGTA